MRGKEIIFGEEATLKIKQVVEEFTAAVTSTLGPGGRTVLIQNSDVAIPHVTQDGVTAAEAIHYSDYFKEAMVSLLKESAKKTADEVGDGTTTSTLLSGMLIKLGLDNIQNTTNRRQFFAGMEETSNRLNDYLDDCKKIIVEDKEAIKNIIKVSSNSDQTIVDLLGDIVDNVGADGLINVELADNSETTIAISNGASIESRCITIEPGQSRTLLQPYVLLIEGAVEDIHDIKIALEYLSKNTVRPAIIIAKEFSANVIEQVNKNNLRTNNNGQRILDVSLIEAEGFGNTRLTVLRDIALITMAEVVSTDGSTSELLRDFDPSVLGTAEKIVINNRGTMIVPESTIIYDNKVDIDDTVSMLKEELRLAKSEIVIVNLKRRLSKYTKVATILVGGMTVAQATEVKDRVDDAVAAIASAVNGGIIPGAGSVLYAAGRDMVVEIETSDKHKDFKLGSKLLLEACQAPLKTILSNAGYVEGSFDLTLIKDNMTIDAIEGKLVDAYEVGVIDPVMASKKAVVNAVAIAKTILNSYSFIIEEQVYGPTSY